MGGGAGEILRKQQDSPSESRVRERLGETVCVREKGGTEEGRKRERERVGMCVCFLLVRVTVYSVCVTRSLGECDGVSVCYGARAGAAAAAGLTQTVFRRSPPADSVFRSIHGDGDRTA